LDWLLRSDADLSAYSSYSAAWAESAKTNRSDHHRDVLLALGAKRHDDALPDTLITFRDPPLPTEDRFKPQATTEAPKSGMSALAATIIPPSWRVTSFSTLTKEKHAHGAVTPAEPVPSTPATPSAAPAALFLNAPGGAAVGTVVHDWIETWDLTPIDSEAFTQQLNATRLPAPRKDQPNWTDALSELFSTLRVIRLPGYGDTPLHEICPEPHGSEWHFHLPIAGALSVGALARCFEEHAAPDQRSYAASLAALSDEKFHGLLQGFIDRLARVGPAWGVIDWKTNRLGSTLADYDQAGLLNCAMRDHYLLQTHLYLVALRRYLRALGLGGQKIAGAWLVFLRAIAPEEARGVLHINPSEAMLDALDQLFAPASQPIA
jgi:exodeoxyribonuclease V beta subunit